MHSLFGTNYFNENNYEPIIKNIFVQDNDNEMTSDSDSKMEIESKSKAYPAALWSASAVYQAENNQWLMYIFGGSPIVKTQETGIGIYDLNKKEWLTPRQDDAKLPFATEKRWGHSATLCPQGSSNIYLIGGWDNRCQYGETLLYDAKTNELKKLNVKEIDPRAGHSAVCIGTSIYLFGGAYCKGGPYHFYNDLQVFDSKKKSLVRSST